MSAADNGEDALEIISTDMLLHLADHLLEMRDIARHAGCRTLEDLLALAHREAMIQSRVAMRRP